MEQSLPSVLSLMQTNSEDKMSSTLPSNNQEPVSLHCVSGFLKGENDTLTNTVIIQSEFSQSYIPQTQVKMEYDQDASSLVDVNIIEMSPHSHGGATEEFLDLGLQVMKEVPDDVTTGLIPPVEMDDEFERNTLAFSDKPLNRRKKVAERSAASRKRKTTEINCDASIQGMKCSTEQLLSVVHRIVERNTAELLGTVGEEYESIASPDSESELSDSDGPECSSSADVTVGQEIVGAVGSTTDFEYSSAESCDEESKDHLSRQSNSESYWSKDPPPQSETRSSTSRSCPGHALGPSVVTPKDAWELFISENIIDEILRCTNLEGQRAASAKGKLWKEVTKEELKAFIGLTLLIGMEKSEDVPTQELFLDPLQNPLYKATMSGGRFEDIGRYLRFDDKRTRVERETSDTLAAFRYVWDLFLINCRERFIPSDCVTVGEQLVLFRGRCKFLQFKPGPPAKYGIKIFWMCDARVPYAIDAVIYIGRLPGEVNPAENTVLKLSSGLQETGLNITMGNYFTSVPLAEKLLERNLTMVGTLHHNNPDVPPVMWPSKLRALYSSEFGFCGNMSMVSYVPQLKKAKILLSTMHTSKALDKTSAKNKPEVIQYYNLTKGGVDSVDQMTRNYTCRRKTGRWPTLLWYNMLDVAVVNSYSIFIAQHPNFLSSGHSMQRLFMKELVKELVMPQMHRRCEETPKLPKTILEAMKICGVVKSWPGITSQLQEQSDLRKNRKRCSYCRATRDRKVSTTCSHCSAPVCKDHSGMLVICCQCMH
ncbi:uncharacterized protein LOC127414289 isoform X1 [Myxocyprinus asiaticus]|uniref:uncharacterized protein LOC127414289 isoform X1 n=1 Tax=Myxocyprinus asiaticus TaxID=70543 RepID=UPI002222A9D4|nr:uncharacterized protein LOC127414289 isoform X1 [Myxocyprinus asiaticus]